MSHAGMRDAAIYSANRAVAHFPVVFGVTHQGCASGRRQTPLGKIPIYKVECTRSELGLAVKAMGFSFQGIVVRERDLNVKRCAAKTK